MSVGCFGSHPEDRARARELDLYLKQESAAEARQERVVAYANFLMEEGQECYPFTPAHVSEALQETSIGPMSVLAACLAEAEQHKRNDSNRNHLALCSIIQPITEYWRDMAMKDAEEYIE
jgi:hypothetical protein